MPRSTTATTDLEPDFDLDLSETDSYSITPPSTRRSTLEPRVPNNFLPTPTAAVTDPSAPPPSYHEVVGESPGRVPACDLRDYPSQEELPSYDEVLTRQSSQRALFMQGAEETTPTAVGIIDL